MTGQPLDPAVDTLPADLSAIIKRWAAWYEDDPTFGGADWSMRDQDEDLSHCIVREDVPALWADVGRLRNEQSRFIRKSRYLRRENARLSVERDRLAAALAEAQEREQEWMAGARRELDQVRAVCREQADLLAAAQEREADAWDACYEAWVKTVGGDFHPNLLNPYRAALAGEGAADQPSRGLCIGGYTASASHRRDCPYHRTML